MMNVLKWCLSGAQGGDSGCKVGLRSEGSADECAEVAHTERDVVAQMWQGHPAMSSTASPSLTLPILPLCPAAPRV